MALKLKDSFSETESFDSQILGNIPQTDENNAKIFNWDYITYFYWYNYSYFFKMHIFSTFLFRNLKANDF